MSVKLKNIFHILLIWLVAGLLYSAQSYYYRSQIGQQVDGLSIILIDTPYFLFWAVFTPIPIYLLKVFPYNRNQLIKFFTVHVSAALTVSFLQAFLYNGFRLFYTGNIFDFYRTYINAIANLDYSLLVYFVVLLVIGVYGYYLRNQKLQAILARSQLETIRSRLQPHFLFNTLNSITVLIKENPGQAIDIIADLSDLLRHVLKNMEHPYIELEKEIDFIKKYLAIEQIRFGKRLQIMIDYPANIDKLYVPCLLLQPIVENAVQYGVAQNRGQGLIEISIQQEQDCLKILVLNNGYLKYLKTSGNGLGLKITRERLQSLYGSAHKFLLHEIPGKGVQTLIEIPIVKESL